MEVDSELLKDLSPELRELYERQQAELQRLQERLGQKRQNGRSKANPAELIERARTRREVRGRNRAAVEIANRSRELRAAMARVVEDMPGVTVDHERFRLAPTTVQAVLRLYNLPEVQARGGKYRPVPRRRASDRETEETVY